MGGTPSRSLKTAEMDADAGGVTVTDTDQARPPIDFDLRAAVEHLCEPGVITSVVQPIVRPADMVVVGYEALARMPVELDRPPNWWLDIASELGLRHRLERACLLAAARLGPPPEGRVLFVNASPSTISDPTILDLRQDLPEHLVLELTEQEAVDDYHLLQDQLAGWLGSGVRLAVDDAGAGYSSLRHVVELSPDYLKLDRELVRGIDEDPNRRALMRAVVAFAREVGTSVIAEGVETRGELDVLREAEVHLVQGYLLARPGPPWPQIGRTGPSMSTLISSATDDGDQSLDHEEELRRALAGVDNVLEACEIVVETLFRHGPLMSSLYLERNGELRCVAQRGLWQVLDGMPGSVGITGRTWATGQPMVVDDVTSHPDYREAIPGVVAEICVAHSGKRRRRRCTRRGVTLPFGRRHGGVDRVGRPSSRRSPRGHRHQPGKHQMATGGARLGRHLRASGQSALAAAGAPPFPRSCRYGFGMSGNGRTRTDRSPPRPLVR